MRNLVFSSLFAILLLNPFYSSAEDSIPPWQLAKKIFHNEYRFFLKHVTSDRLTSIYDIQAFLNPMLVRAEEEQEYQLIDSVAAILLEAVNSLKEVEWYPANSSKKIDSVKLERPYRMWLFPKNLNMGGNPVTVREEFHLSSSQFLFLVAQVLRIGASLPGGVYPNIDKVIEIYPSILLDNHYQRWIFDTKTFRLSGWGCAKGNFNHLEFLHLKWERKFRFKRSICRTIFDSDLMIAAGVAQVLAAYKTDSSLINIDKSLVILYEKYLKEVEAIIGDRIELRDIKLRDTTLPGFAFDNGLYRDYEDNRYSLYTDTIYPNPKIKLKPSNDAAWDISHARRFFFIFNSFEIASAKIDLTLPYAQYLEALAHQFYHVIYADTIHHLFNNYINGENGWYRVGYHGKGSGTPPYGLSQSALEGGWFFLGKYYSPIEQMAPEIWRDINHKPAYYNNYYGAIYKNGEIQRRTFTPSLSGPERFVLLQWLPGIH